MATIQEIKDKLGEYEAAVADREAKQAQHQADSESLNAAVLAEQASRTAWIAALQSEHVVEDQLEALIVDHEPPAVPDEPQP